LADNQEERNRILGVPIVPGQHRISDVQQRVLGFPVEWFNALDLGWVHRLSYPIRAFQRWVRSRRAN
jgi:hypothetical protein